MEILLIGGLDGWLPMLAIIGLFVTLAALIAFAVNDWRSHQQRKPPSGYRYRRSAHERFAAGVAYQAKESQAQPQPPPPPQHQPSVDAPAPVEVADDELLRQLLDT